MVLSFIKTHIHHSLALKRRYLLILIFDEPVKSREMGRLRKKSGCCVALHSSSLRRTPKYASFLRIRAPCLQPFYEAVPFS